MAERCFLSVKFSASGTPGNGARAVGAFLRYVQYRDQHEDTPERDTSGLLRYVAYRDRTSPRGQLFGPDGPAGDLERKALAAHIKRSAVGVSRTAGRRPTRTAYRFVLSPERAEGLDLRELARAAMSRLEEDAGQLPPWVAAVHRNTAHPHVHIVLAARREVGPGRFQELRITRPRLAAIKAAIGVELGRQRGERAPEPPVLRRPGRTWRRPARVVSSNRLFDGIGFALRRLARRYRKEMERELELARERELVAQRTRSGWER